ncbi:MAG: HAMP domain-containing protein [Candidatus Kapabacteria bacterium]|nr:HAMP domain-containing protein [Candidatus Kapabacteria bacterium]
MRGFNFATKFAFILSATALVSVGIIGYWLSSISLDELSQNARNFYDVVAHDVRSRLQEKTAKTVGILQEAREVLASPELTNQSAYNFISSALERNRSDVNALGVYDIEGNFVDAFAVGAAQDVLPRKLPQALVDSLRNMVGTSDSNKAVVWRTMRTVEGNIPVIPIAIGYGRGDGTRGILSCVLAGQELSNFITRASKDAFGGKEDRMFIVDDSLRLLASYDTTALRKQESLLGIGIFKEVTSLSQVSFSRDAVASKEYKGFGGEQMVGTYISIPDLQSALVIEQPASFVYKSVNEMRKSIFFSLIAVGTAAIVISFAVARQISRPINQLLEASERIAEQDFDYRLDESRGDEFGILFQSRNRVAGELARYQQMNLNKIVGTRNKLESVVRQASDGFIVIEPNRSIFVMNDVFAHWFGVDAITAEGRSFLDVLPDYELKKNIMDAFTGEATHIPVQFTLQLVGEADETVVKGTFVRVVNDDVLTAVMGVLRDVTREVAVDRMKTELVSIVAHELRSPLNTIRGFSDLIGKGLEEDETKEFASIITSEADRLNAVITKFLDINRIESGRTDMRKVPFRLHEVINNVIKINMPLAEEKRMTLDMEIPLATTPIIGDPDLIGQVFLNLFTNAIKYSDPGKTVRVEVIEGATDMRVNVTDQGYGISESAQEKLFTKFFRATDDERVRQHVGTGLGLAFIKEIVEKHNGEMGVHSQINVGSTFWFVLPK